MVRHSPYSSSSRPCAARHSLIVGALIATLAIFGCSRGTEATESETTPDTEASESDRSRRELRGELVIDPSTSSRLERLDEAQSLCSSDAEERCNAVDDDCDGSVDEEGCSYDPGRVQVTVTWNTDADINLYVREPDGDLLSHQRQRSYRGGVVGASGRGACDPDRPHPRIESIAWTGPDIPLGRYEVEIHRWGDCMDRTTAPGELVRVLISVVVDEELLGTFAVELAQQERLRGVAFDIDAI